MGNGWTDDGAHVWRNILAATSSVGGMPTVRSPDLDYALSRATRLPSCVTRAVAMCRAPGQVDAADEFN
jgi:hypothetical protein